MRDGITYRPITSEDEPFLREVYASTREEELRLVAWSHAEQAAFLRMQFDAQHRHYQASYPEAEFSVVLFDGTAIGRLYLDRGEQEYRIIDIALLPAWRRKGIGSRIMERICSEAAAREKPVVIHVERFNPALRLYERLGFVVEEDGPVYLRMKKCSSVKAAEKA